MWEFCLREICIFHSNSSVPPNNINVFVFMFHDNDEDVVYSSCVRLQIPLAMHSFLFPQSIWPEMISKNDLIFLSKPWLSPYHRNVSKTEHDVVSEQFVQFVNNIWQFCSPSASPLTDPPLLPMFKCRLPMIRKLGKLYLCYWDWGTDVSLVDAFTDQTFPNTTTFYSVSL